jgi:hypothetical protein
MKPHLASVPGQYQFSSLGQGGDRDGDPKGRDEAAEGRIDHGRCQRGSSLIPDGAFQGTECTHRPLPAGGHNARDFRDVANRADGRFIAARIPRRPAGRPAQRRAHPDLARGPRRRRARPGRDDRWSRGPHACDLALVVRHRRTENGGRAARSRQRRRRTGAPEPGQSCTRGTGDFRARVADRVALFRGRRRTVAEPMGAPGTRAAGQRDQGRGGRPQAGRFRPHLPQARHRFVRTPRRVQPVRGGHAGGQSRAGVMGRSPRSCRACGLVPRDAVRRAYRPADRSGRRPGRASPPR